MLQGDSPNPTELVTATAFRSVLAEFVSGVTVVTAEWQGVAHAMTATAFCSVSLQPPLVLVCVGRSSRFHAAITGAGRWGISLLSDDQGPLARHFSHKGRELSTQFAGIDTVPGPYSGAPLLTGARGWLDCTTHAVHDGGDHTIVVGRVLHASRAESAERPLTYFRGGYSDGA